MSNHTNTIRLTDDMRTRIRKLADETDRSPSSVLMRILMMAESPIGKIWLGVSKTEVAMYDRPDFLPHPPDAEPVPVVYVAKGE